MTHFKSFNVLSNYKILKNLCIYHSEFSNYKLISFFLKQILQKVMPIFFNPKKYMGFKPASPCLKTNRIEKKKKGRRTVLPRGERERLERSSISGLDTEVHWG